jgi:hypothetical protein
MDGLGQTVWNCGQFGPNRPKLILDGFAQNRPDFFLKKKIKSYNHYYFFNIIIIIIIIFVQRIAIKASFLFPTIARTYAISISISFSTSPMLSHYPSNINSKPKTNTKYKTNTIQTQKKKNKDPSGGLEESGDEEAGGARERERKREPAEKSNYSGRILSLYSCHKSGQAWVLAGSDLICQTHARTPA